MVVKKQFVIIFFMVCYSLFLSNNGNGNTSFATKRIQYLENRAKKFETIFYYSDKIDSSIYLDGFQTFNQLIESCIATQQQSGDHRFAEKAYYYLERLKSIKLLLILKSANFSDSTRTRQYHLLSKQLELYRFQPGSIDPSDSIQYADSVTKNESIRFQNSMQLFQDSVRSVDPNLYLLLLFQQPLHLKEIQQYYLHQNQIILDFWVHDDRLFVFIIASDAITIFQYELAAGKIKSKIFELMSPLHQNQDLLQLKFDYRLAYQLYQQLFQPLEKYVQHFKEIIVIPDHFLTGFPFEILVTDTSFKKHVPAKDILYNNLSALPFLVYRNAFSYNYSIKALAPQLMKLQIVNNLGRRLLAMSEPIITSSSNYSSFEIDEMYFQFQTMNATSSEVKKVTRLLWWYDNLKNEWVTKNYFFSNGRDYRWIYLALPGIFNNSHPMNSALLFTQDYSDSIVSTAWLTAGEVMKHRLSADLLTMTGCQILPLAGEVNQGIIALPQSFLYTGVKSVLFNQWRVNSSSTGEFMAKFFWEIKYKRQTNVLALQQAKIAFLKSSYSFSGQKISKAHPHFWASFMLIGNPNVRSPFKERIPQWGVIIIVYCIVIIVSLFITRKTRPK